MAEKIYDVWTDRQDDRLRVVVRQGDGVPARFANVDMKRLGSVMVAKDIAEDVETRGFYAMSTSVPFDAKGTLGVSF